MLRYVHDFLSIGCSVLMTDIDVVYLQNPFLSLHKDSDVEGTTDGWDDGSAYGWTEALDDPSMGATGRFRPAMRITAWNSGLWYARATHASLRLMEILKYRMETEDTWDQAAFGEEMSRPARDSHLAGGITKRALNHWCFANSKTIFRRVRTEERFAEHMPVVVHANYHQPKPPRMSAVYDRWHLGKKDALNRFSGEQVPATCSPPPECPAGMPPTESLARPPTKPLAPRLRRPRLGLAFATGVPSGWALLLPRYCPGCNSRLSPSPRRRLRRTFCT